MTMLAIREPWSLVIRERDGKMRAVRADVPLSGWCKDIWGVLRAVDRKDPR